MWLNSIEIFSGRIARWALEFQQYDLENNIRGQLNVVADALSRKPLPETLRGIKETMPTLDPGGCSWIRDMCEKKFSNPCHKTRDTHDI